MHTNKQPTEYQTGSTKPPKSHGGIVAFLLSAVIFLCGISTILSLLRINLLQKWSMQAENRLCKASFVAQPATNAAESAAMQLGFQGVALPDFWQDFHALPEGLFITRTAAGQALQPGDILLSINGQQVQNWDQLTEILEEYASGDKVSATVYRSGARKQLHFTIAR